MVVRRLEVKDIFDLFGFVDDSHQISMELALMLCGGEKPSHPCAQIYGAFEGAEMVSMITATYCVVYPHKDGTKIVQLSGAYTKESERGKGYASAILEMIEHDAKVYFNADYLCCDSSADELYYKHGFKKSDESRLWKPL